ncbi:glycosyltransferase [Streptomyces sp. SID1121]|uniref:glycosyltransferase n=1 Tax=Streptomyces sp. SID1121 TaxID=3425888 RepID=UPI0040573B93
MTFLTGPQFRASVEETGAKFVPLVGKAAWDLDRPEVFFPERASFASGFPQLEYDMMHVFADPIPDQYASVKSLVDELGSDTLVIQDAWFFGTWPFKLGAQGPYPKGIISVGITVLPVTSVDAPPFGTGLPPDSSPAGQNRNRELNAQMKNELFAPLQNHLVALLESVGAKEPAPFYFDGMVTIPDVYLHLGIEAFEYPRSDAPSNIRYIGNLPVSGGRAYELPDWWDDVTSADSVVVVTQGTVANQDFDELIEPTIEALEGGSSLVVVLTGRSAQPTRVPQNVRVAEFIPFDLILPHTDVLVSNAGYGGVQLALNHGTPMVLAGATEDKPDVSARAAWAGAAVSLATNKPSSDDLRTAVATVTGNPQYRAHAQRLQAEYAQHDAFAELAAVIERLSH